QEMPAVVESPSKPAMPTPMGGLPKVTFQQAPSSPSAHHVASVQEASRRASAFQPSIEELADADPYRPVFAPRDDITDAPTQAKPDKKPAEPRMPWLPIGEGDD